MFLVQITKSDSSIVKRAEVCKVIIIPRFLNLFSFFQKMTFKPFLQCCRRLFKTSTTKFQESEYRKFESYGGAISTESFIRLNPFDALSGMI